MKNVRQVGEPLRQVRATQAAGRARGVEDLQLEVRGVRRGQIVRKGRLGTSRSGHGPHGQAADHAHQEHDGQIGRPPIVERGTQSVPRDSEHHLIVHVNGLAVHGVGTLSVLALPPSSASESPGHDVVAAAKLGGTTTCDWEPQAGLELAHRGGQTGCSGGRRGHPEERCAGTGLGDGRLEVTVSRLGGRGTDRYAGSCRGRSGLRRAGCWLTASRGDPQDSATERKPPMAGLAARTGKGERVR